MPDHLDWCLPYCVCGGLKRGTECEDMPGCRNCLEIVGAMGIVVGTLGDFFVALDASSFQEAIQQMVDSRPPRYMN